MRERLWKEFRGHTFDIHILRPFPILAQDMIYVGGSTHNMFGVWRVYGVDGAFRRA